MNSTHSRKLNQAKKLLNYLKEDVKTFFDSQPFQIATKRDNAMRLIYFVSKADQQPESISAFIGDILQNLRSALDHKAYELFKANSNELGRHIYFPIEKSKETYEAIKERRTHGMSQKSKDFIDLIKPYKEGNYILWQLHELNNLDKHRTIITSGSGFNGVDVDAYVRNIPNFIPKDFPKMPVYIKPADNLFPLTVGKELLTDMPNAAEIPDMQFNFQLVINEPGITEGEDIFLFLEKLITEVDKQISDISNNLGI